MGLILEPIDFVIIPSKFGKFALEAFLPTLVEDFFLGLLLNLKGLLHEESLSLHFGIFT